MSASDFSAYPVVSNPIYDGEKKITPGTIHDELWWKELYEWILKLTRHPSYPSITPSDLIALYMLHHGESSQQYLSGYVYSKSEYTESISDGTEIYIQGSLIPLKIEETYHVLSTQMIDLKTYTTNITFSHANYFKKIVIGLVVNNGLSIHIQQSSTEYSTYAAALADSTTFEGMIVLGMVIVQHSSSVSASLDASGLTIIPQSSIVNIGLNHFQYNSSYIPIIEESQYSLGLRNNIDHTVIMSQEIQNHVSDMSLHTNSVAVRDHIANSSLHGTQSVVISHMADTTIHIPESQFLAHINNADIHGGGSVNIDDSSFGADVTWSADKISTELTQITSDVNIQTSDTSIFVPQITDIVVYNGIHIADEGAGKVGLYLEHSLCWEANSFTNNTRISLRKIFGRSGRLMRLSAYLETRGTGTDVSFQILKNGIQCVDTSLLTFTTSDQSLISSLNGEGVQQTDYFEVMCINAGTGAMNVSIQLTIF